MQHVYAGSMNPASGIIILGCTIIALFFYLFTLCPLINSYQLGKLVPFMMNYVFLCKNCSPTGLESFKKNQCRMCWPMCAIAAFNDELLFFTDDQVFLSSFFSEFTQMCITTIANLMQTSTKEGKSRQYFSRDKEIVPYIESHWEYIVRAGISQS